MQSSSISVFHQALFVLNVTQDVFWDLIYVIQKQRIACALPQFDALHDLCCHQATDFVKFTCESLPGSKAHREAILQEVNSRMHGALADGDAAKGWRALPPDVRTRVEQSWDRGSLEELLCITLKRLLRITAYCSFAACTQSTLFSCARCGAGYCSEACQRSAWQSGHAAACKDMQTHVHAVVKDRRLIVVSLELCHMTWLSMKAPIAVNTLQLMRELDASIGRFKERSC